MADLSEVKTDGIGGLWFYWHLHQKAITENEREGLDTSVAREKARRLALELMGRGEDFGLTACYFGPVDESREIPVADLLVRHEVLMDIITRDDTPLTEEATKHCRRVALQLAYYGVDDLDQEIVLNAPDVKSEARRAGGVATAH